MNNNYQKSTLNFLNSIKSAELINIGSNISKQLAALVLAKAYKRVLLVYPADFEPPVADFITHCLKHGIELYLLGWYKKNHYTYSKVDKAELDLEYYHYTKQPRMLVGKKVNIAFDLIILPVMNYDHECRCIDYDLHLNYHIFKTHKTDTTTICGYATCFQEYTSIPNSYYSFQLDYVVNEFRLITAIEKPMKK